jgi:thymidylate synthase
MGIDSLGLKYNAGQFKRMFDETMSDGLHSAPRGLSIRELQDYQLVIDPSYPFMGFKARNYNLGYFKKEMAWKLGASKYDASIKEHAKMWASVQNPDGTFNSNYGVYWFGSQMGFQTALNELIRDKDSRRAVIPMLTSEHMTPETIDTVCTECVGFRIRENTLFMSVHMRSSDQVFGLGTDLPTFSFLYRLMFAMLQSVHSELEVGTLTVTAMSSHIYGNHFRMIADVLEESKDDYVVHHMPWCDANEAMKLIAYRGKRLQECGELGRWLAS